MKQKSSWTRLVIWVLVALAIHLFSINERWVEQYYSNGIYPFISFFLRGLLGWLPFSLGDILYGAVVIWLLVKAAKSLRLIFKKQFFRREFLPSVQRTLVRLLIIYVCFNILWGINYNRKGIAWQLGLSTEEYSVSELKSLSAALLQKVNESSTLLMQNAPTRMGADQIIDRSQQAYLEVEKKYPFLNSPDYAFDGDGLARQNAYIQKKCNNEFLLHSYIYIPDL